MGSFRPVAGNPHLHGYYNFTESLVETVPRSLRLSCGSEPIDLGEISREVGTIISGRTAEAGIAFEIGKQEFPVSYVYGSPLHIRQIFLNIYGNCIKYNKPHGKVTTTLKCLGEKMVLSHIAGQFQIQALE